MHWWAVAFGGALGAVSRYGVSIWVTRWSSSPFPWATLTVNVTGSFLLGLLMGLGDEGRWLIPPTVRLFLGIGFLGAFTTFSTFSYETVEAIRLGAGRLALANVALSLLTTLPACWVGLMVGSRA